MGAVMEGKHSVDVGILILPILIELMTYIAETAGVKYKTGKDETPDEAEASQSTIALAVQRAKDKIKNEQLPVPGLEEEDELDIGADMGGTAMGLMSRRQ